VAAVRVCVWQVVHVAAVCVCVCGRWCMWLQCVCVCVCVCGRWCM
jgi:hypothetical protein